MFLVFLSSRKSLDDYVDVIKSDRTPRDILIQVMLEFGIDLSTSIEEIKIGGHTIFNVDNGLEILGLSCYTGTLMGAGDFTA